MPLRRRTLRVLYADDMRDLREIVRIGLGREGHQVECVADGAVALERVSTHPADFDIVISDHHMPHVNGLELVQKLRELNIPSKIIVFSSELSEDVTAAYRALKVDRILFKPVDLSALRRLVQEV